MNQVEFEGKTYQLSADGFVALSTFSEELFDLSPENLGSFFNPEDRFYKKYEKLRHGLRHNINFLRIPRGKNVVLVCEGGIFHDDFKEFIHRARQAISINNQMFDQAVQQWREHPSTVGENRKTLFRSPKLIRLLRLIAGVVRRIAKVID